MNSIKFTLFIDPAGCNSFNFSAMFLLSLWVFSWLFFITFCTPSSMFFIKKFFLACCLSSLGFVIWYRSLLSLTLPYSLYTFSRFGFYPLLLFSPRLSTDPDFTFCWIEGNRFLLLLKKISWFEVSNFIWLNPSCVILICVYSAYLWNFGDAAFCLKTNALLN